MINLFNNLNVGLNKYLLILLRKIGFGFRKCWGILLLVYTILLILLIINGIYLKSIGWSWADWTGFGEYKTTITTDIEQFTPISGGSQNTLKSTTTSTELHPGKTLWDWLGVIVGAFFAVFIAVLNEINQERRQKTERSIAQDRQWEATMQYYFDKMTELLMDKDDPLNKSKKDSPPRSVARARTLSVLKILDGTRKGLLLQFLYDADLLKKQDPIVDLHEADLSSAILTGAFLSDADLIGVNLENANLSYASLAGTNFTRASLVNTDFTEANLSAASLVGSDLSGAIMIRSSMIAAELREADLTKANLSGAHITDVQLKYVKSLAGITMPDGRRIK